MKQEGSSWGPTIWLEAHLAQRLFAQELSRKENTCDLWPDT
jgi:hypothetical protein